TLLQGLIVPAYHPVGLMLRLSRGQFAMRHLKISALLLSTLLTAVQLLVFAPPTFADEKIDTLDQLRAENAALREKLAILQASCPNLAAPDKSSATTPTASVTVPEGYQLVKVKPAEPYSLTGCKKYKDAVDTRWKQRDNWEILSRGLSMRDVEDLLGIEHYDISSSNRIGWKYGKCGAAAKGEVVFEDGKVLFWRKPIF
ncbi:MAG: hypothetical protein M0P19_09590, partial [Nevskia sp.]|nr:hypothetical protein [Nevskia sp.]